MSKDTPDEAPEIHATHPDTTKCEAAWRQAVSTWCMSYRADKGAWGDKEWDDWTEQYASLRAATQDLASHLAVRGIDVSPLNYLARLCDPYADEWTDEDDGGDGDRLLAIAEIVRLLQPQPAVAGEATQRPSPSHAHDAPALAPSDPTANPLIPPGHLPPQPDATSTPSPPSTERTRMLVGWQEVLGALRVENVRKKQVWLKRLNARMGGPIRWIGKKPTVDSTALSKWVNSIERRVIEDGCDIGAELNHPTEIKERGFQLKKRPNNPGTLSRKIDPLD